MNRLATVSTLIIAAVFLSGCAESEDPAAEPAASPTAVTPSAGETTDTALPEAPPVVAENSAPMSTPRLPDPGETEPVEGTFQDPGELPADGTANVVVTEPDEPEPTRLPDDLFDNSKVQPLNENNTVLLDLAGKRLLLRTTVSLTLGQLEMLLCLKQTKEHESILSIDSKAFTIHTGLLALGSKEGTPSRYDPEKDTHHRAEGQIIDVFLHWVDTDGKLHRESAQNWVRRARFRYYEEPFETLPDGLTLASDGDLRYDEMNKLIFWYGPMSEEQRDEHLKLSDDAKYRKAIERFYEESQSKPMRDDWLFVGSGFYDDEELGRQYLAESGYVICVANFSMAMIDVSTRSSAGTDSLTYEAWTERIPPRDSEVLVELVPRLMKAGEPDKAATDETPAEKPVDAKTDATPDSGVR